MAHEGFTVDEATTTEAGRIRGVLLDTVAMRCGQVPDVHPRLLEAIEVAARLLAEGSTYEGAYDAGESSQLADWMIALDDVLPDEVECRPSAVAAWIRSLDQ